MLRNIIAKIFGYKDNNSNKIENRNVKLKRSAAKRIFFDREMKQWLAENDEKYYSNYLYFDNNCCPNCGVVMDVLIKNSKTCPQCKKKIVMRTNKENSKKLLLTEDEAKKYDKFDEKRKDILFYERQINALNNMYPNYMYYFWNLKKEKTDMSARDYAWSFENWLFNKTDVDTVKEYQKHLKYKFQDRIIECDRDVMALIYSSNVYRYMIDIALYKKQYDVAEEMMLSLIYRSVTLAHLSYYHWEDRPVSEIQFYSDASFGMNYVKEYLERNKMNFEDLKEKFMQRAHPFLMNIVTKEDAWPMLCEAYKRYIYLVDNNRFYGEK